MAATTIKDISNPDTYKGLYSFHKYWGKKPTESITFFIQNYTESTDIVLDPFLGSGLISRECLSKRRRFIGIDVNPHSIEHTNFLLDLPEASLFRDALKSIEINIKQKINDTYHTSDGKIGSHYLWSGKNLSKIWFKPEIGRSKVEIDPSRFDLENFNSFTQYKIRNIRDATFFTNSRINSSSQMSIYDLFTSRALHNIDLILDEIKLLPDTLKRAFLLTLTSSSGQMSSMVFAITNRGKTKQQTSNKIEVGSWVIGYWRPELHFEINVWNCFESRANKLYKALLNINTHKYLQHESINALLENKQGAAILNGDCLSIMKTIPEKTIKLICTDPPHGDRIPYLELSEMWNSILNEEVYFEREIVISNAKERNKKKDEYIRQMKLLISQSDRILTNDGMFLMYFNARDKQSWRFLEVLESSSDLKFVGTFPMEYSANSVVQDNRKGGLKTDCVLVFAKKEASIKFQQKLNKISGWSTSLPKANSASQSLIR
ncbi:DNA methyltransferase [Leptolyngbya sp. NIES-2104]|uniref:DNA methyltransferase n=1 Tax=Leptolyngbya sp. NIES-2104 TaxID=1552121 RepID=UPI0006ECCDBD|nr:DNA methyltransferase [Leptolyngbya sp. NIES-2104]GAP94596.1 adenine-specific methyltransferase [Leptolyngbya sp. NIES-2104]